MRGAESQDQVGDRHGPSLAGGDGLAVEFAAAVGLDQRLVDGRWLMGLVYQGVGGAAMMA